MQRSALGRVLDHGFIAIALLAVTVLLFSASGLRLPQAVLVALPATTAVAMCFGLAERAMSRRKSNRASQERDLERAVLHFNALTPSDALTWILPTFAKHNGASILRVNGSSALCAIGGKTILVFAAPCPANEGLSARKTLAIRRCAARCGADIAAVFAPIPPEKRPRDALCMPVTTLVWLGSEHLRALLPMLDLTGIAHIASREKTRVLDRIARPEIAKPSLLYAALLVVFYVLTSAWIALAMSLALACVSITAQIRRLKRRADETKPFGA